jgi:glycosyltransferase involved in cell wall biosynthesis
MKKKILFVTPHMIAGGVEKSLISLLNELPDEQYDVTVLMVKARGHFLEFIPRKVKVKEMGLPTNVGEQLLLGGAKASIIYNLKKLQIITALRIFIEKAFLKKPMPELRMQFSNIHEEVEFYDIAICYHMHMPFILRYVAEKVKARKKLLWIHNDFINSGFNPKIVEKYLESYSHYFTVSAQLKEEFISILPKYKDKTSVFYNILSTETMRSMALEGESFNDDFDGIRIFSIGRLDSQKGFDIAVDVCSKLIKNKYKIKWYIIGEGKERARLENLIKKENLQEYFILLGIKTNPYAYLRDSDLYVQPSRHEGYCITLAEARCFNKPIVTTNFVGALEQIKNNETGKIVECNVDSIFDGIKVLLDNENLREHFSRNLSLENPSNESEVQNLLKF